MASSDIVFTSYVEGGPPLMVPNTTSKIQASFRVSPIHVTTANTLRRQILAAVPTLGFKTEPPELSDVFIDTNTTPLVNEMLMHRIGMIPIAVTNPQEFNVENYEFRLNVENVGKEPVNVTASNIKVIHKTPEGTEETMKTEDFFPVDPITKESSLITVLRQQYNMDTPTEKLSIRAKASVGTGRQNMRYSPVAQCSYEYTQSEDQSEIDRMYKTWLFTSKKVPDPEKLPAERTTELRREFDNLERQRCFLKNEKGEPYDFIFHVESVGIFSVPKIVELGWKACEDLVTPYTTLDVEILQNVSIAPAKTRSAVQGFEITFQNEEHTLGNLLQTFLVERHIEGTEIPKLQYAAYKVPHPLRQEMVLFVTPADGQEATARKAVANVCKYLKGYFNDAMNQWVSTPKGPVAPKPELQQAPEPLVTAAAAKRRTAAAKRK